MTRLFMLLVWVTPLALAGCYDSSGTPRPAPSASLPSFQPTAWSALAPGSQPYTQHSGRVLALTEVRTPDTLGEAFVTVGGDGAVLLWNTASGSAHKVKQLPPGISGAALGEKRSVVAWSDTHSVSVGCVSGCSKEWHLTSLKVKVTHLAFQGQDDALLLAGADGRVYRWAFVRGDLATSPHEKERSLERYVGHQTVVSVVANHPFQRAFFSADWDGALYGWLPYSADDHQGAYDRNLFTGRAYTDATSFVRALRAFDRGISAMAVSHDGNRLALGTDEGYVEIWEVRGLTLAAKKQVHRGRVLSVALDATGDRVVSSGRDSSVTVSAMQPDPEYGVRLNTQPNLLALVSSQRIEGGEKVLFLGNNHIIVTTKDGLLAELSGSMAPQAVPTPMSTTSVSPLANDTDY